MVIPTLHTWPDSVVVTDIKGENFRLTAVASNWRATTVCSSVVGVTFRLAACASNRTASGSGNRIVKFFWFAAIWLELLKLVSRTRAQLASEDQRFWAVPPFPRFLLAPHESGCLPNDVAGFPLLARCAAASYLHHRMSDVSKFSRARRRAEHGCLAHHNRAIADPLKGKNKVEQAYR